MIIGTLNPVTHAIKPIEKTESRKLARCILSTRSQSRIASQRDKQDEKKTKNDKAS